MQESSQCIESVANSASRMLPLERMMPEMTQTVGEAELLQECIPFWTRVPPVIQSHGQLGRGEPRPPPTQWPNAQQSAESLLALEAPGSRALTLFNGILRPRSTRFSARISRAFPLVLRPFFLVRRRWAWVFGRVRRWRIGRLAFGV